MVVRRSTRGKARNPKPGEGSGENEESFSRKIERDSPAVKAARQRLFARLARERFKRSQAAKRGYEKALFRKIKKLDAELQEIKAETKLEEVKAEIEINRRRRIEKARAAFEEKKREVERERAARKPLVGIVDVETIAAKQREEIMEARALQSAKKNIEIAAAGTSQERAAEGERIRQEVVMGKEMMEERLDRFYHEQLAEGKVHKIKKGRRPGYTYRREGPLHQGLISSRFKGRVIDDELREEVAAEASRIAERLLPRIKDGKLYATFSFYEYGRHHPKSSYEAKTDELGTFWQSFDSVGSRFGVVTDSVSDFEMRVRELLLDHATEQNAVVLDAFEVKAFRQKSDDERKEWNRKMRARLRAREGKGKK